MSPVRRAAVRHAAQEGLEALLNDAGRPRVLVVEDDDLTREVVAAFLEEHGYDVRTAADGLRALDVARVWNPHVILLDLVLPRMNGWGFAAAYRRRGGGRAPIIAMTAAAPRAAQAASEIGAEDVLPKPLEFDRLLALLAVCTRDVAA